MACQTNKEVKYKNAPPANPGGAIYLHHGPRGRCLRARVVVSRVRKRREHGPQPRAEGTVGPQMRVGTDPSAVACSRPSYVRASLYAAFATHCVLIDDMIVPKHYGQTVKNIGTNGEYRTEAF